MRKFEVLLSWPSWPFLSCSKLGPDNNTYLAQIITPQNGIFVFFAYKNVLKYLFCSVFNINQNIAKSNQRNKKNDNFSHFAKKRRVHKNPRYVATPLFQKLVLFFTYLFLKAKTLMLNKKAQIESGKTKTRKRDLKEKTRPETKQRERIDEKKL